jgi:hypothetical protein
MVGPPLLGGKRLGWFTHSDRSPYVTPSHLTVLTSYIPRKGREKGVRKLVAASGEPIRRVKEQRR